MGKLKKGLVGAGASALALGGVIIGLSGDPVKPEDVASYERIIKTTHGKELKISGGNIIEAKVIREGETEKLEIPRNKVPKRASCNVVFVAEEIEVDGRKLPNVDPKLLKMFGSKGNSTPIKLRTVDRLLPKYYWNALLIGEACVLSAEHNGYYASSWEQIEKLPEEIKEDLLLVEASFDDHGQIVRKSVPYGSAELDTALEVFGTHFPNSWAGRKDLNFEEPEDGKVEEPKKDIIVP